MNCGFERDEVDGKSVFMCVVGCGDAEKAEKADKFDTASESCVGSKATSCHWLCSLTARRIIIIYFLIQSRMNPEQETVNNN